MSNPKKGNLGSQDSDILADVGTAYVPERRVDSHLYVITAEITKRVKIGQALDVKTRFRQLASMSPDKLTLYAWAEWCGPYEGIMRRHFEAHRVHGEWFDGKIMDEISPRVSPTNEYRWAASDELERLVDDIVKQHQFAKVFIKPNRVVEEAARLKTRATSHSARVEDVIAANEPVEVYLDPITTIGRKVADEFRGLPSSAYRILHTTTDPYIKHRGTRFDGLPKIRQFMTTFRLRTPKI